MHLNIDISTDFLLLLLGLLIAVFGIGRLMMIRRIVNNGIETDAVIVDVVEEYSRPNDRYFYPVVQFKLDHNDENSWVEVKSSTGHYPARYKKHDKIKIRYLADDYKEFIINGSNLEAWLMIFFMLIGSAMALYYLFKVLYVL